MWRTAGKPSDRVRQLQYPHRDIELGFVDSSVHECFNRVLKTTNASTLADRFPTKESLVREITFGIEYGMVTKYAEGDGAVEFIKLPGESIFAIAVSVGGCMRSLDPITQVYTTWSHDLPSLALNPLRPIMNMITERHYQIIDVHTAPSLSPMGLADQENAEKRQNMLKCNFVVYLLSAGNKKRIGGGL
ncbi:hypothetical protein CLF_104544 [Clonorchis sinensis]|uniref:Uncharacterized protein n=1 Tax=Clonorchis sinensis TaxID=79923 RepID=G7YBV5_CLOSI|nr:hypothetical protein CLF_104544 [Clonorchis sinensis]